MLFYSLSLLVSNRLIYRADKVSRSLYENEKRLEHDTEAATDQTFVQSTILSLSLLLHDMRMERARCRC